MIRHLLRVMKRKAFLITRFLKDIDGVICVEKGESFQQYFIKEQVIDLKDKLLPEIQLLKKDGYIQFKFKTGYKAETLLKKLIK